MATNLAEQLNAIIGLLREQILIISTRIHTLENKIIEADKIQEPSKEIITVQAPVSKEKLKSPKEELLTFEVEAQTSFPLEPVPIGIETLDTYVQTVKEPKTSENISVIQQIQGDHETIRIDCIPNKDASSGSEDVFVEARYQTPKSDIEKCTELLVKNVPQSFETTFVEPDETTTEVLVDPDGTKRIIVKKITRAHRQVIQKMQPHVTSVTTTLTGSYKTPLEAEQAVQRITTMSGDDYSDPYMVETGPETFTITESEDGERVIQSTGDEPNFVVTPDNDWDLIRRKIVRKTKRIIKRVTIIDGKEHVTEEVIEEPEEIEISEEDFRQPPKVNVSVITTIDDKNILKLADDQQQALEVEQPLPQESTVFEKVTPTEDGKVKLVESVELLKEEQAIEKEPEEKELTPPSTAQESEILPTKTVDEEKPFEEEIQEVIEHEVIPAEVTQEKVRKEKSVEEETEMKPTELTQESEEVVEKEKTGEEEETQKVFEYEIAPVELTFDKALPVDIIQSSITHANNLMIGSPVKVEKMPETDTETVVIEKLTDIKEIWPEQHHLQPTNIEFSTTKYSVEEPITTEIVQIISPITEHEQIEEIKDIWPSNDSSGFDLNLTTYTFEKPLVTEHEGPTQISRKNITVTAPTSDSTGESTLKVRLDTDPTQKTKIHMNIIEIGTEAIPSKAEIISTTEQQKTTPTDEEFDLKRSRKRKKKKEKEESLEIGVECLPPEIEPVQTELPSVEPISGEVISVDETPLPTKELPEEPTIITETPLEEKVETAEKLEEMIDENEKEKKKEKEDKEHAVPTTTELFDITQEKGILQEKLEEISPESTYTSISEDNNFPVKIVEEGILDHEESSVPAVTEIIIPKEVLEISYVDDQEQQTLPSEEPSVEVKPPVSTEARSIQASPAVSSQQTSFDMQPDVQEDESQTIIIQSVEAEAQTSPQLELQSESKPTTAVEMMEQEVQTELKHPTVEQGIQETPETGEISSQTIIIDTTEQKQQTSLDDEEYIKPKIPSAAEVVPSVLNDVINDIIQILPEKTEQITAVTVGEIPPVVQPQPELQPPQQITVDTIPSSIIEKPYVEESPEISLSSSMEPYDIEIQATLTFPEGVHMQEEPRVFEYTKVIELPCEKEEKDIEKKKDKKKKKKSKSKKQPEINISVEVDPNLLTGVDVKSVTKGFLDNEKLSAPKPEKATESEIQVTEVTVPSTKPEKSKKKKPDKVTSEVCDIDTRPKTIEIIDNASLNVETPSHQMIELQSEVSIQKPVEVEIVSVDTSIDSPQQIQLPKEVSFAISEKEELPYVQSIQPIVEDQQVPLLSQTSKDPEPKVVSLTIQKTTVFDDSPSVVVKPPLTAEEDVATETDKPDKLMYISSTTVEETIQSPDSSSVVKPSLTVEEDVTTETDKPNKLMYISSATVEETVQPPIKPSLTVEVDVTTETDKPDKLLYISSATVEETIQPPDTVDISVAPSSEINKIELQQVKVSPLITASQDIICSEPIIEYPDEQQIEQIKSQQPEEILTSITAPVINYRLRHLNVISHKPTPITAILHLTTLNTQVTEEPIENIMKDTSQAIENLQTSVNDQNAPEIQGTTITIIEKISTWLETIEYRMYVIRQQLQDGPSEEKIDEYNRLNNEIHAIGRNVMNLEQAMQKAEPIISSPNHQQIQKCIGSLKDHLHVVNDMTKDSADENIQNLERWNQYLVEIQRVKILLNDLQERFNDIVSRDSTIEDKLINLDNLEQLNLDGMERVGKLAKSTRSFISEFPGKSIPQDAYLIREINKNLANDIILERDRLMQLKALAEEYEQTLKEFANITLLADRLVENPIHSNTLEELQDEMQKHRKFFVNLSHCRAILESLEENIDKETSEKHAELHKDLYNRATVILEKAADRAQKLALAASRWTVLEKGMKDERQWLQVAHQRVPDLSSVTSADYDQYTTLYQSLNTDIVHHHAKMTQLLNIASKLQELVNAPNLVEESNEALITLLKLREEVTLYLHRLLVFREAWVMYDQITDRLENWVKNTEKELEQIEIPQDLRKQPIEHMRQFWEVKAQFEMHNAIRVDAGNYFEKSLQVIPLADEMLQRQFHAQLEDRWINIAKKIDDTQNVIVNSISSPEVPVEDKIQLLQRELEEIQHTITNVKNVIKNDDELSLYIERMQVLKSRVGIIGNELGRIGLQQFTQPEKIGELFALSHRISTTIAEELEGATLLKDRLLAIQDGITAVRKNQAKLSIILDDCESCEKMGSDAVEKALSDCQEVNDDLIIQWQEIMRLRQCLHTLPMRLRVTVSPVKLERDISQLQDEHAFLESRSGNTLSLLRNRLSLWKRFERQLELVQESIQETDFMMELLKVHGQVDYKRLLKATERLEGLSADLENRESLLNELKISAKPLIETCDGPIVEQIEATVQEAVSNWNDICDNLHNLCAKYQRAAKLWERYREASTTVKSWIDQQMQTLESLNQEPLESVHQIKECEESLSEQNQKLSDLRNIVMQIESDVGLDQSNFLQNELDALEHRLQDVKKSITVLADVADSQAKECEKRNENVTEARNYLNSVEKYISAAPSATTADAENQLVALRSHLFTLTKTEEQLKNLQEKSLDQYDSKEVSIIEVLELWQKIFQETFQEYHRLSSRLIRNQDSAEVMKLWRQYLEHVQLFLSSSIPNDYFSLKEHRHLCEVHQNLLTNQQSILSVHYDEANTNQNIDPVIAQQYKMMTNLHNETLSQIMDRNNEIEMRLKTWNSYRSDLTILLEWLKEREKERSKLQLRYMHVKRIPRLKHRIETLLESISVGEEMAAKLKEQQPRLLKFCDDALATSVRMEHASITQRIANLRAALETWRDFLLRVIQLSQTYEAKIKFLQTEFDKVQKLIDDSSKNLVNANVIQERLIALRSQRVEIGNITSELEHLSVIQEKLKECINPHDMKSIRQMVWIMRQKHSDLDMQLSDLINVMEERLSLHALFLERYTKISKWVEEMERRINREADINLTRGGSQFSVEQLENEIQSEIALREKEREWILSTGHELLSLYDNGIQNMAGDIRADIQSKMDNLIERWERLKYFCKQRNNKINDLRITILPLEERIAQIRRWLFEMELELSKLLTISSVEPEEIEKILKDHDKIQRSIEKESSTVGEVLNLCEMLLNDTDIWSTNPNILGLREVSQNLEKRWKNVCRMSADRKNNILSIWRLLTDVLKLTAENEKWLKQQLTDLETLEKDLKKLSKDEIPNRIHAVEMKIKEIESRDPSFKTLQQSYAKLAMIYGLNPETIRNLTTPAKQMLEEWQQLVPRAYAIIDILNKDIRIHKEFINNHEKIILSLTQIDAELTQFQHLPKSGKEQDPNEQLKKIENIEAGLRDMQKLIDKTDELGTETKKRVNKNELGNIEMLIEEYQSLWKDIQNRLTAIKREILDNIKSKSREADECVQKQIKYEQDNAVQVNTLRKLPKMSSITAKDAYIMELETAVDECRTNLDELQKAVQDKTKEIGPQKISKLMANCQSSVELMKHLSTLLATECSSTNEEAQLDTVTELSLHFANLQSEWKDRQQQEQNNSSETGKLTCPLCTQKNWHQIDNDLWRLEQWLQFAEGTQKGQTTPPNNIELLEDVVQDHREFLLDLESHKSIVSSLNVVGDHLATHTLDTEKAKQLRNRLEQVNERWNKVCLKAAKWQEMLQTELMGNKEFHQTIDELCIWLQETERTIKSSEPVDLTEDRSVLEGKFMKFKELRIELERFEPRVISLQEAADQLLKTSDNSESSTSTYARLTDLRLRLLSLRRLSGIYIVKLGAVLGYAGDNLGVSLHMLSNDLLELSDSRNQNQPSYSSIQATPSQSTENTNANDTLDEEINTTVLARGCRFFGRVVRASLPIQALMLLLLGVATLVPHGDDYTCVFSNTFARSLEPMLSYPNGPPPI